MSSWGGRGKRNSSSPGDTLKSANKSNRSPWLIRENILRSIFASDCFATQPTNKISCFQFKLNTVMYDDYSWLLKFKWWTALQATNPSLQSMAAKDDGQGPRGAILKARGMCSFQGVFSPHCQWKLPLHLRKTHLTLSHQFLDFTGAFCNARNLNLTGPSLGIVIQSCGLT